MTATLHNSKDTSERGEEIYEKCLRAQVETEANVGKIIMIDVETGDYEIDDDLLQAGHRLKLRHPTSATWTKRIGYDAVYALGGTLVRTNQVKR